MKNHTKTYFKESGIDPYGFIPCEICHSVGIDLHHIECKGMGGNPNKDKDVFENLMMLCRRCHDFYGDKSKHKAFLKFMHAEKFPHLLTYLEDEEKIIRK